MLPVHGLIIVELQPKINCNSTINLTKIRPLILWDLPKTLITAWSSAIILRTDLQKFLASIFKALLIGKPALQSPITGRARRLLSISASRLRSWTVTNCPSCRQKAQKSPRRKGRGRSKACTICRRLYAPYSSTKGYCACSNKRLSTRSSITSFCSGVSIIKSAAAIFTWLSISFPFLNLTYYFLGIQLS